VRGREGWDWRGGEGGFPKSPPLKIPDPPLTPAPNISQFVWTTVGLDTVPGMI